MEQLGVEVRVENRALTPDEIGLLAGLIVDEPDHYTALGVDRNASNNDLSEAYRLAVEFFHPLKSRTTTDSDSVIHWNLSSAWVRLEKAFSVLSSHSRRKIYDDNLSGQNLGSISTQHPLSGYPSNATENDQWRSSVAQQGKTHNLPTTTGERKTPATPKTDRRRAERTPLSLPLRVSFEHCWQELTHTLDVSPLGIRFYLSRRIEPGCRLQVELPMPKDLRTHGYEDEMYMAAAYVVYVIQDSGGRQVVAEFV